MQKVLNINKENKGRSFVKELAELEKIKAMEKHDNPTVSIEFSWKLILLLTIVLGLIFFGEQIASIAFFIFFAVVLMSSALPIVNWLVSKKFTKGWAVVLTFFTGIVLLLAIIAIVVIPLVGQIDNLINTVPVWIKNFTSNFNGLGFGDYRLDSTVINKTVSDWLEKLTLVDSFETLAVALGGVFSWTSLLFAAFIFSIYLVLDHDNILDLGLIKITSDEKRERVKRLVLDVEAKLGRWLLGQATVSTIAGTVLGLVLALFNVPFALPMGVFIALMSTIPSLGATIAVIPPLLVALIVNGPITALAILLIFIVYQQIENNFIIPRVMGNAMGVRPILILFTAAAFLILFGIWGAVLAVPVIVIGRICYEFYIDLQKLKAKGSI
ncbi:hypothetical protein A3K02_01715 [candidate division WS6 bacterium RIFOXYD1_FULL_33_8]|nr:MAG: hypothetical protein UR84_C0018G0010 [candidate division WS6 bacterium GW2011_GWD1_35_594]OGC35694.1 MAG: hypothetical protein A2369_03245 [candidate division WS6 bacterium RIFOXYB1_FULL_33_15]OGC37531.1 MAG: hypothetical protein A2436_00570 [candidate division WS6 bacterium RIFOXYC1_FULL_33_9]OGC43411.1 MAG: hypothetical protein A3K02_01715 [candidate division WS6 bacterium RIFOXYD1_FULL_33_8]HBB64978.1 hypothetical protein [Patescibacteria group bacterium]